MANGVCPSPPPGYESDSEGISLPNKKCITLNLEQPDMIDVYYKTELIRLFLSLQQFTTGDLKSLSGKLLKSGTSLYFLTADFLTYS